MLIFWIYFLILAVRFCFSATFYDCSPTQLAEIGTAIGHLDLLTFLSYEATKLGNYELFADSRFRLHFRQDNVYVRRIVHGHIRPIYFEARSSCRRWLGGRQVPITCYDRSDSCQIEGVKYAYLTDDQQMIVLVRSALAVPVACL